MLITRPNYEDKTVPAQAFKVITQSLKRTYHAVTPQSIGIATVAAALVGVFLSGLFQLRAYQQKPASAVAARPSKALPPAAIVKASAASSASRTSEAVPVKRMAPKAVASVPAIKAAKPATQVHSARSTTAGYWNRDDERAPRRGHARGHGKHKPHKHKGNHGKGKHGH